MYRLYNLDRGVNCGRERSIFGYRTQRVPIRGYEKLRTALDLSLRMNPPTPDHHFYIDQGTNARLRIVLIAIGKKLVKAGLIDDPEDVMFLRYNELRLLMTNPAAIDASTLVSQRRDEHEQAYQIRPREWVGTATKTAVEFFGELILKGE